MRLATNTRGKDIKIKVVEINTKTKDMVFVGEEECNTAMHYGDKAVAGQIVSRVKGHKMKDSYDLLSKNIKLHEVGAY